jgi:hypothetical protein
MPWVLVEYRFSGKTLDPRRAAQNACFWMWFRTRSWKPHHFSDIGLELQAAFSLLGVAVLRFNRGVGNITGKSNITGAACRSVSFRRAVAKNRLNGVMAFMLSIYSRARIWLIAIGTLMIVTKCGIAKHNISTCQVAEPVPKRIPRNECYQQVCVRNIHRIIQRDDRGRIHSETGAFWAWQGGVART